MTDIWKLMRCVSPRQLILSCILLAVVLAVGLSHLFWSLYTGAVPDGLTLVAVSVSIVVATPIVQIFVLTIDNLHRSNERLIAVQTQLEHNNAELASTRDALTTLNGDLEARVAERTTELAKALDVAERANAAKSTFLANMSHELRTPLNGVIGYAEMIVERDALFGTMPPKQIDEYAGAILSSGRHLNAMVSNLLDLSRVEFGHYELAPETLCVQSLVQDAVDGLAPVALARGQTVEVIVHPCAPLIEVDGRAMRQILTNLLSNALKYSQDGDTVTVTLASAPDAFRFEISDTGIGMEDDTILRATQPFSKFSDAHIAAGQSVGLGLAIVKRLCDLLDATFAMTSIEGRGTTASVSLPLRKTMAQPDRPVALAG